MDNIVTSTAFFILRIETDKRQVIFWQLHQTLQEAISQIASELIIQM